MKPAGRILIVDDTLASLKLMSDVLKAESYDVYATDSGELALAAAMAKVPDLILCDIRMPGISGLDVCRRLKAQASTRDIPLMFISATTAVDEKVAGFEAGAVDFVSKPFQRDELLARVRTHLELAQLRSQLEQRVLQRTNELNSVRIQAQKYLDLVEVTIVSLDREGRIRMLNEAGMRLFGYGNDTEVVGRSWFSDFLAQPQGLGLELPEYLNVAEGKTQGVNYSENTVVTSSGERREMAWRHSYERDVDGTLVTVLSAGTDITDQRANEVFKLQLTEELRAALRSLSAMNEKLEERVLERTSELESTHLKLRQASRQLAQAERTASLVSMVSGVAHEIVAPMRISLDKISDLKVQVHTLGEILQTNDEINRDRRIHPKNECSDFLEKIQMTADTVHNNFLKIVQIVDQFEHLTLIHDDEDRCTFLLQSLVGEVLTNQMLLFKVSRHQVTLIIEPKLQIEGYPRALGQVLNNLINNALTHAFADEVTGEICIAANHTGENEIQIILTDNGRGIGVDILPHVFEPFFTTRRSQGGRGLGLSIVYATVHGILGGSIEIENKLGGGVKITLTLPVPAPERQGVLSQ